MPLLPSARHTPADLDAWARLERLDRIRAADGRWPRREAAAMDAIRAFFAAGRGYVGVSWGKDSVVVAHLARRVDPTIPLVWVHERPVANPDCPTVRDAFLAAFPGPYDEIDAWCRQDADGWHATGTIEAGFAEADRRHGARHVSGIRGKESGTRTMRMRTYGTTTANTCAPIGWWSGPDVFAYLCRHDLPVHPAYAMSRGGLLDRERLRVSSLGRRHGTGHGRRDWELTYYGAEMAMLGEGPRVAW
jgi:phosphoadenosine phosphosulfate reductase